MHLNRCLSFDAYTSLELSAESCDKLLFLDGTELPKIWANDISWGKIGKEFRSGAFGLTAWAGKASKWRAAVNMSQSAVDLQSAIH